MSADVVYQPRLARRFNIPSMDDLSKWDESWVKVLGGLSSEDVFTALNDTWKTDQEGTSALSDLPKRIRSRVLRSQEMAYKLLHELEDRDFTFVWVLMKDEQLKAHYFNGLKAACAQSSLQEDARALCPEITINMMSKRIDYKFFLMHFNRGVQSAGEGNLALLYSDWWNAAVKTPEPWPEDVKFAFTQFTLQRNEFITAFVLHSVLSIVREQNFLSPIANLLKSEGFFSSSAWSYTSAITTPIRCTYCTGSSEELGEKLKFSVCGRCKANASNPVYYCSRPCQLADWSKHKPHCGKVKTPSSNSGDRQWHHYTVEHSQPPHDVVRANVTSAPKASNPERQPSPDLQRQITLLKAHPDADYFFFDDKGHPVPFVVASPDHLVRLNFHNFQEECLFGREVRGLDVIAEYMMKDMGKRPGLSMARILKQLSKEYLVDVGEMVVQLQSQKAAKGYDPGTTFLEAMGKDILKDLLRPQ